ncbi:MAG TPA: DUF2911 domain-containing protein [Terriglobales bacterium]|nr:DUF2911 domain-containing protein [Terriglobales bacterium]
MRRFLASLFTFVLFSSILLAQQEDKSKRPSPPGTAEITIAGKKITINYSRPKIKDPKTGAVRKIYGGLVPYGEVWRTGANEATELITEADLSIGGVSVPKGTYTLFTIPGEKGWMLIINKQTGQWGRDYDVKQDLARVDMKTEPIEIPIEQFTISFMEKGKDGATLRLDWEKTRAWVEFTAK